MAEQLMSADGATLDDIAEHIHTSELMRKLKRLLTDGTKNYAMLDKPSPSPRKEIKILPAPAVGPTGSTKICDGKLTVGGQAIDVTAFRLA